MQNVPFVFDGGADEAGSVGWASGGDELEGVAVLRCRAFCGLFRQEESLINHGPALGEASDLVSHLLWSRLIAHQR
ncbi:MAG: hypothetical protein H7836_18050 [Magnetococcus sp. YQC-3]